MVSTKPAKGMRDMLPRDVRRREYVVKIIREVYQAHGFDPLETPSMERLDTLLGKYGEEGDQLVFRVMKRGANLHRALQKDHPDQNTLSDHALRYDLTVPLARIYAEYSNDLPRFFKRYQIQPVWRADRPAKGRFREFFQCDVDIVGCTTLCAEAEVMGAVASVLERLNFSDTRIHLNHRKLLNGLIEVSGISQENATGALISIDKIDKIGWDGVANEMQERGISSESIEKIRPFLHLPTNDPNATLQALEDALADSKDGLQGVHELRTLLRYIENTPAGSRTDIAPSLARGLSYYTGPIFEVTSPNFKGSLGGGGRYDNLIGMFRGKDVPAVGFSLGLERLLVLMEERGMFPDLTAASDVTVMMMSENDAPHVFKLLTNLRKRGIRADLYPDFDKLGKQFKYADSRGTPFVAILGSSEIEAGNVTLKELATGTQKTLSLDEAVAWMKNA